MFSACCPLCKGRLPLLFLVARCIPLPRDLGFSKCFIHVSLMMFYILSNGQQRAGPLFTVCRACNGVNRSFLLCNLVCSYTELGNFLGEQKWSLKMTVFHFCLQLSIFITLIHIWALHISPSWPLLSVFILSVFDWHCRKEGKIAQMLRAWIWVPCVRSDSYLSRAVPVKVLFWV